MRTSPADRCPRCITGIEPRRASATSQRFCRSAISGDKDRSRSATTRAWRRSGPMTWRAMSPSGAGTPPAIAGSSSADPGATRRTCSSAKTRSHHLPARRTTAFVPASYPSPPAPSVTGPVERLGRDFAREKPVDTSVFRAFRGMYDYAETPLNASVDAVEEQEHWRRERITLDAAYGGERVIAYLFLPAARSRPTRPWCTSRHRCRCLPARSTRVRC